MGVVILCPGQGQVPRDLGEQVLAAGEDLAQAYAARLGADAHLDPSASWARLQAALVVVGIARGRRALALLEADEPTAAEATYGPLLAVAGHSLGELTALVIAGALDPADAVALAADRGQAVQDEFRVNDWGDAAMLALSGPTVHDHVDGLLTAHGASLANDNAADQVVVSGAGAALTAIAADARELGLRAVRLETTGPSHSTYMQPVVAPLRAAVERITFREPAVPVYSGLTAAPFTDLPTELSELIAGRVRWRETLIAAAELGPTHFLDIGPGGAMARLARKSAPGIETLTLDGLEVAA